jgi:hypothetical protein
MMKKCNLYIMFLICMFSLLIGSKYLFEMVTVFFVLSFSYDDDESTLNEYRERERERERERVEREEDAAMKLSVNCCSTALSSSHQMLLWSTSTLLL